MMYVEYKYVYNSYSLVAMYGFYNILTCGFLEKQTLGKRQNFDFWVNSFPFGNKTMQDLFALLL